MIQVIRHGHSFVEIETAEGSYLIDPFITDNPKCDISVEEVVQKNILGIFLTHGHADHIGDTVAIYTATKAPIVCEYGIATYFEKDHNIECLAGSIGGTLTCGAATVKFFVAHHGGAILDTNYVCVPAGLLITVAGKSIYHAGDTGLTHDMKLLGEHHTVDVACVPIGDIYTMGVIDGARAISYIKPENAFPMHYDTWPKLRVDPIEWARLVMQDTKTVPKVLKPGQYVVLDS